jgi:type II secretory pathway component PulM
MDTNAILENLKNLVNQARERIRRAAVSDRDRKTIFWAGLGLLVLILYATFQFFSSGSARLERKAQSIQADLKKFESLRAEYLGSRRKIAELAGAIRPGDEPLISVVEKVLIDSRVEKGSFSIRSRTPTGGDLYEETSVDVEIKKIPLDRMVNVLYKIQTMPTFLKVSKFRPQTRFDNPDVMDVSFRISTFKFNQVL